MKCPHCQQTLADNARFCASCGQKIAAPSVAMAPPVEPVVAHAAAGVAGAAAAEQSTLSSAATAGFFDRVKNILLTPKREWPVIAPEPTSAAQLYTGYVMPMAAFAAVMTLIHLSVIGSSLPFGGSFRMPMLSGLLMAAWTFGVGMLFLFLFSLLVNALAPTFGGQREQRQALKFSAYAFTPVWFGSVFGLLPGLSGLLQFAAGCYGIYVFYLGVPPMMRAPRERAVGYTVTVVICTFLLGLLLSFGMMALGVFSHGGPFGADVFGQNSVESQAAAREQAAASVGNVIGGMLGTDEKGKEGIGKAFDQVAQSGEQMQKQEEQAAAKSAAPAATSTDAGTTDASPGSANPAAAVGGLMAALGGALGGPHRVDPVDFHNLKTFLPESLSGLPRTSIEGANNEAVGVKGSSATAFYQGSGAPRIDVKISDISGVAGLLGMAKNFGAETVESESSAGFEKNVTLGGRQFHEKFDSANQQSNMDIIVAQRFEVDITGHHMNMDALEQAAGQIDIGRLESLKNDGAKAN